MKFITYLQNNENFEKVGVLTENGVLPLEKTKVNYPSMNELIENITDDEMKYLLNLSTASDEKYFLNVDEVKILAPIPCPKQDILCLGINYFAHAVEAGKYKKESFGGERKLPIYFSKRVNRAVAPDDYIDGHFDIVDSLDYECELAFVLKKDAKNVKPENAFEYIFGYTIINDVSARNLQTQHKQWYLGKSLDDFTPMGPCIVTVDEIDNPPKLKIMSRINGELRQNSTTDILIFDIPYILSDLTKGMTLKAGTIVATGTPAGVGMGMEPPVFLKSGDVVECEIEKIGILKNIVK